MSEVLVIGPGKLGGQIAFHCLLLKKVDEVFLVGKDIKNTTGIAADLLQAFPKKKILAIDSYVPPKTVDLTVFSFSKLSWHPTINVNDREIEEIDNLNIIDKISKTSNHSLYGTILIVSNPVDILTNYASKKMNPSNIFGFGLSLDEHRILHLDNLPRYLKGKKIICIGEHGANFVTILSTITSKKVDNSMYRKLKEKVFEDTQMIIKNHSIPLYAPLLKIIEIIKLLINQESGIVSLSKFLDYSYFGVQNLSIGVPVIFENGKSKSLLNLKLNDFEINLFHSASNKIREAYNGIPEKRKNNNP